MTIYRGRYFQIEDVRLGPPAFDTIPELAPDVADSYSHWAAAAQEQENTIYFAIYSGGAREDPQNLVVYTWDRAAGENG